MCCCTGSPLDFTLFLENGLIQRHHNGRQGGMRSSHLVQQINSAFVEPFYGLTSADGRSWGRFGTLFNVAETIQSHSPRTLSFLGQNGLVGSRPGQDYESGDDESGDDESGATERSSRSRTRTQLGDLRIDGSAVDVNRYRFAQWSEVRRLEITCAKAPGTFRSLVSMPTGTNAIIVNLEPTTDTIDCLSRLAVVHQNLGAAAMIVLAPLVEMGTYGARLCAPAATVRAL